MDMGMDKGADAQTCITINTQPGSQMAINFTITNIQPESLMGKKFSQTY